MLGSLDFKENPPRIEKIISSYFKGLGLFFVSMLDCWYEYCEIFFICNYLHSFTYILPKATITLLDKLGALKMTVQTFNNLVEQANEGMSIIQDTLVKYLNPSMAGMMGYVVSEVLNTPFINYIHPDSREKVFNCYSSRIAEEVFPSEYKVALLHRKGHNIPVEVNASISSYKGNPADLIVINETIERKTAVEAAKESEKSFRDLADILPQIIFECNERGDVTFANRHTLKCTGYTEEDLDTSLNVLKLFVPEDRERVKNNIARRLGREITGNNEYRAMRKDGRRFPVILECSPIMCGERPVGLRGVLTEITERKQGGEALGETEERYRFLFENSQDAIFIADPKTHRIVDANKQAEKLIGYSQEEIIGMHQSQLHPPEYDEYYREKFREHVRKSSVFDLETEIMKRDKGIVPVSIRASVIRHQGKEMILGLFTDISGEKRLLELKEELAARKLVERAKGILMDRHKIDEKKAMSRLQRESRRQSKKIKEIAQAVISSELFF